MEQPNSVFTTSQKNYDILCNSTADEPIEINTDSVDKTQEVPAPPSCINLEPETDIKPGTSDGDSPDPTCAICLGKLENKSYTNECRHPFCFTCLVEWSKVKAECPLCKQHFTKIMHSFKSDTEYEIYDIMRRHEPFCMRVNRSRVRHNHVVTFRRSGLVIRHMHRRHHTATESLLASSMERQMASMERQMASHRLRYAPHSVRSNEISEHVQRAPCNFRRLIYQTNKWVSPEINRQRSRIISPDFFSQNQACTHRLIPWLNRELFALLPGNDTQVTVVLELILSLIMRYDIQSHEFYSYLSPYLGDYTRHFIHEFRVFAESAYDMHNFDRLALYTHSNQVYGEQSLAKTETEPESYDIPSTSGEPSTSGMTRKSQHAYKRLKKLVLKRDHENNSWLRITNPNYTDSDSNSPARLDQQPTYDVSIPSTSGLNRCSSTDTIYSTRISSDDELEVVFEGKPRVKTPEVVNISSGEDDDVQQLSDSSSVEFISTSENHSTGFYREMVAIPYDRERSNRDFGYRPSECQRINFFTSVSQPCECQHCLRPRPASSSDGCSNASNVAQVGTPSVDSYSSDEFTIYDSRTVNTSFTSMQPADESSHRKRLRSVIVKSSFHDSSNSHSHKKHKSKHKKKKRHHRHYFDTDSD